MSEYKRLRVTEDKGVITVSLAREDARNALDRTLIRELTEVARRYRSAPNVHAVILRGTNKFFSAGADLGGVGEDGDAGSAEAPTLLEMREAVLAGPDMCKAWEEMEPVTIAAIEGYCVGGATALVMCCDFRILGKGAMLRLPEVPLGINMSWHTLPRLVTIAGPSRAKRFTMFGEATPADRLLEWGMADEIVANGEATNEAGKWARKITKLPPIPVRMTKEAINAAANANHRASTFMDRDQYLLTFMTEDFKEGVQAFFEKREPQFKGK
ncbi:MAG: enoyl-CoA hydratase/isomerase family protein [Pseudomonadota bacterium]